MVQPCINCIYLRFIAAGSQHFSLFWDMFATEQKEFFLFFLSDDQMVSLEES